MWSLPGPLLVLLFFCFCFDPFFFGVVQSGGGLCVCVCVCVCVLTATFRFGIETNERFWLRFGVFFFLFFWVLWNENKIWNNKKDFSFCGDGGGRKFAAVSNSLDGERSPRQPELTYRVVCWICSSLFFVIFCCFFWVGGLVWFLGCSLPRFVSQSSTKSQKHPVNTHPISVNLNRIKVKPLPTWMASKIQFQTRFNKAKPSKNQ